MLSSLFFADFFSPSPLSETLVFTDIPSAMSEVDSLATIETALMAVWKFEYTMATLSALAKVSQNVAETMANTVRNPVIWKLEFNAISGYFFSKNLRKDFADASQRTDAKVPSGATKNMVAMAAYIHPNWMNRSDAP